MPSVAQAISDGLHVARTLARAGMLRPSRPAARGLIYDQQCPAVVGQARARRTCFVAHAQPADTGDDTTLAQLIAGRVDSPLPPPLQPGRAVILTSGTTGTPKGANRPTPS